MISLKNEIIGSWELLSYIEVPVNGIDSVFPFGKTPKGLLIFSPDGYMSVQISVSDEIRYISNDRVLASDDEIKRRVLNYLAFSGRYEVDNRNAYVIYAIETSFYPNWEGSEMVRKLNFEGEVLYQKSLEPVLSDGRMVNVYMTWKKAGKEIEQLNYQEERILINTFS